MNAVAKTAIQPSSLRISREENWILPLSAIVALTLAMLSIVVFAPGF
jgi:hypothetical protein